jgi:integrase/recombinase XerD
MTSLANYLSLYLREYLPISRGASFNTCESYAYTFQLLVNYTANQLNIRPSQLTIENLDAERIVQFLNYLEVERNNSVRTRNARIAAIKAFFRFLEYRLVSCIEQFQLIQAIPTKKTVDRLVGHLTPQEMQALLDAPDLRTTSGIRDRAMITLCFSAGLRVSELVGLCLDQINWCQQPTINVIGKGRKERILPLWKETTNVVKEWISIRPKVNTPEIFLNSKHCAMTRSGFKYILSKHIKIAALTQPSLIVKHVSPHTLRHTCALNTLKSTHDIRKVSLWLGHENMKSTEIYLRLDTSEKLETLMQVVPPMLRKGKFTVPDKLLSMLKNQT